MSVVPPPDLRAVMERLLTLAETVDAGYTADTELGPEEISLALRQLEDELTRIANEAIPRGISHLADQGLELIAELSDIADDSGMSDIATEIELLSFPFVLWSVRKGARIGGITPVVNALALLANAVQRPEELAQMFREMGEIVNAIIPEAQENAERDPAHPWRVLILNRAIVATRCHDPEMMEEAYDEVIESLPADALNFFQEAMGQMDAVGYPDAVRDLVNTYYLKVAGRPMLH